MYVPSNTPLVGSITPVATVDVSLHTFIGISWHILLPYTVLGLGLMLYSQTMLMRGRRALKRLDALK